MIQNEFLILRLYILALDELAVLDINPTSVLVTLNRSLEMRNETYDSGHLNAPFKRMFAMCLHLLSSARANPWPDFGKVVTKTTFSRSAIQRRF